MKSWWVAVVALVSHAAFANVPPQRPTILEPALERQSINGADLHMVTAALVDEDGDAHVCTDWEIEQDEALVWSAPCVSGAEKLHIHLGDGTFVGTHLGATELRPSSEFLLRVRHRDSGDEATAWSEWATRSFVTVQPTPIAPFLLDHVPANREPRWKSIAGHEIEIAMGASLAVESVDGDALLRIDSDGVDRSSPRSSRIVVRLHLAATTTEWVLPQSDLTFEDEAGQERTLYLPEVSLGAGDEIVYWISANGSTHRANLLDRAPDFTRVVRGAPVPWDVARGFVVERFASGFELPVAVAPVLNPGSSSDSPFLYVAELYGSVKVVTRSGDVRAFASDLLNFDPRAPIPGGGERGIGGITIDPANGDVIVTAIYQPDPETPFIAPRVLRLQSDDGGRTAARVLTVIAFPNEVAVPSHQISTVSFGPDDKLYVHVGSNLVELAQDLNSIDGKILRMNRDGSAPSDNPFFDESDGITARDYIFASGFRNPFGGAWRSEDQSLYEVENGPSVDRLARVYAGENYGWDGTDESMRKFALYNWEQAVAPVQIVFTEANRFDGSGFPAEKHASAFVTESGATWATGPQRNGKQITEFVFAEDGALAGDPIPLARYNGSGKATAAGLAAGEGGLYFTDLYRDFGQSSPFDGGANLFRIEWKGYADFAVRFDSAYKLQLTDRSTVKDIETIEWDFGDGTTSTEREPVKQYRTSGTFLLRQKVTGAGGTFVQARRVYVGDAPVRITATYFESDRFDEPRVIRHEDALQFNWSDGTPEPALLNRGFAARFETSITPRFSETYRFTAETYDRIRLLLDGAIVLDGWEADERGERSATIELEAGRTYVLTIDYVDDPESLPFLSVLWESDNQQRRIVPMSVDYRKRRAAGLW